jgi:hypothetical protein
MRLLHLIMVMQLKAAQRQTIDRQVAKLRETRQHWSAEEHMEHAVKEQGARRVADQDDARRERALEDSGS